LTDKHDRPIRWWFVEDALRDLQGHWIEYAATFRDGLHALGDQCHFFGPIDADARIHEEFNADCCLPPSIWHRMSDSVSRVKRLMRIPRHGWGTYRAVASLVKQQPAPDIIFVPTVLVHHLVGWLRLFDGPLKRLNKTKVLLFFPNAPISYDAGSGQTRLASDPTAKLFGWLIRRMGPAVREGRVILAAETEPMRIALQAITGVPFVYLPHPVTIPNRILESNDTTNLHDGGPLVFGAYGAARHEKGSDLLLEAVERFLTKRPDINVRFDIQWLGDFRGSDGKLFTRSQWLLQHPKVRFIESFFAEGEYARQLSSTDAMILPYRENYSLRVSRVVIEAMLYGMPVIATRDTTLYQQADRYGSVIGIDAADCDSLAGAIEYLFENWSDRTRCAEPTRAIEHFSIAHFRKRLIDACQ